jgi:SAM-dependent methyltransferase
VLSDLARHIELSPDGIWRTSASARVSFPDDGNRLCFVIEDSSFWFRHRRNCLLALLERFPPPGTFFDVGGGNGYLSSAVQNAGRQVVLIEPGEDGARNAQTRGVQHILCGRLEDAGFQPATLPAIGLFDVLEHIEDDRAFLQLCRSLQPPGARLYLTVPAFQLLWSGEDELAGHYRRYRRAELIALLEAAGYEIEFSSYLFEFLVLPVLALRTIPYRLGIRRRRETEAGVRADHATPRGVGRALLNRLMQRELAAMKRQHPLRSGTSIVLVARHRLPEALDRVRASP